MDKYAIIVAGGSGSRMGNTIPKQFLEINAKPILVHTIDKFLSIENIKIIVVLPEIHINFWQKILIKFPYLLDIQIVYGGDTRFKSVKNGLSQIPDTGVVAIHDAVRPFVNISEIENCYNQAAKSKAVVLAVPSKDSVRIITENGSKALDRSKVYLIQTPQTFDIELVKKAYAQTENTLFTDDASVVELWGHGIQIVQGSYENIKITSPDDLLLAEKLILNS